MVTQFSADFLRCLMALTRKQDSVLISRHLGTYFDSLLARIGLNYLRIRYICRPRNDLMTDLRRILKPRVIVRDNNNVGPSRSNLAHKWTFALIAAAV